MNFLEYLKSIYDNMENEKNLDQRVPFLELEYWFKRWNKDYYSQIFIIDKNEEVLATIGEDLENIYKYLEFIKEKNAYIKLWASGVKFGKVNTFEKYFKYNKEDEIFCELNYFHKEKNINIISLAVDASMDKKGKLS